MATMLYQTNNSTLTRVEWKLFTYTWSERAKDAEKKEAVRREGNIKSNHGPTIAFGQCFIDARIFYSVKTVHLRQELRFSFGVASN